MIQEDVIKGLECLAKQHGIVGVCEPENCPYGDLHTCTNEIARDALALLKAQATTREAEWLIFKGRRGATCSYCKYTFDDVYDPENYDYYCRHCGSKMVRIRAVKWE